MLHTSSSKRTVGSRAFLDENMTEIRDGILEQNSFHIFFVWGGLFHFFQSHQTMCLHISWKTKNSSKDDLAPLQTTALSCYWYKGDLHNAWEFNDFPHLSLGADDTRPLLMASFFHYKSINKSFISSNFSPSNIHLFTIRL